MYHASAVFKASSYASVSPDGRHITSLNGSIVTVRSTKTLETVNTIRLPSDIGHVTSLIWSPSSSKLLVSSSDQVLLVSAYDTSYQAAIRNPTTAGSRPPLLEFGATDTEVLACAPFGLKLTIFDLSLSKAVEIGNPKFHHAAKFARGCSTRPRGGGHLALLTRSAGRDTISIHDPHTRQVQRSWQPDLVDTQGLLWTPDGMCLLLWESPAQGSRLVVYTSDGQLMRTIEPPGSSQNPDASLAPGIRLCSVAQEAPLCAVCDYSRTVRLLSTATWRDSMRFLHPTTIVPKDTIQVWQEQLDPSSKSRTARSFQRATQMVSPPSAQLDPKSSAQLRSGCSMASFDAGTRLLATRLDDSPGTVWIWDLAAGELRAVLIFHSAVNFEWHSKVPELLLVRCLDEGHLGVYFIWDPLFNGLAPIYAEQHLPDAKIDGKVHLTWVGWDAASAPTLLLSSANTFALLSSASSTDNQANATWQQQPDEGTVDVVNRVDMSTTLRGEDSVLDDTFAFKKEASDLFRRP